MDKAFADCSIPQEKSNAEINAELGISDVDEDACDAPSNYMELDCRHTSGMKHLVGVEEKLDQTQALVRACALIHKGFTFS